jgi:hypothetical protein
MTCPTKEAVCAHACASAGDSTGAYPGGSRSVSNRTISAWPLFRARSRAVRRLLTRGAYSNSSSTIDSWPLVAASTIAGPPSPRAFHRPPYSGDWRSSITINSCPYCAATNSACPACGGCGHDSSRLTMVRCPPPAALTSAAPPMQSARACSKQRRTRASSPSSQASTRFWFLLRKWSSGEGWWMHAWLDACHQWTDAWVPLCACVGTHAYMGRMHAWMQCETSHAGGGHA